MPEEYIPELNMMKKKFERLVKQDFSSMSPEDIINEFYHIYGVLYRPIYINSPETCSALTVYRVISEEDVVRLKLDTSKTGAFSYPPSPEKGRANIKGQPVLYTADNPHTAIYENIVADTDGCVGKSFYLSEWKLRPGTTMNSILLLYGIIESDHFYYEIAKDTFERIKKTMNIYSRAGRNSLEYIAKSLGLLFKQNHHYLSSVLAHHWLYFDRENDTAHVDCLVYPSVQKIKSAVNYAFHPEFVDKYMYIASVKKIRINEIAVKGASFFLEQLGKVSEKSMNWYTAHFRIPKVDLLNTQKQIVKSYSEEEVNGLTFHILVEEVRLPERLKEVLQEKLQNDLCDTLLLSTPNPKIYPIQFPIELEYEQSKVKYMMYHIEFIYEQISN